MASQKHDHYVGMWEYLIETFTAPLLAHSIGCTTFDIEAWANNHKRIPEDYAFELHHFCLLHGVAPTLHRYADWKHHNGVMIVCEPEGWMAWSLNSEDGYLKKSFWGGSPNSLGNVDGDLLARARSKNWRW